MRMFTRRNYFFHVRLIQCFVLFALVYLLYNYIQSARRQLSYLFIPKECRCTNPVTGDVYDFCYELPETKERGRKFNCSHISAVEDLGLVSSYEKSYVNLESESLPTPVFVTAFSENHFLEGKQLLMTVRKHWPQQKVVFYDLGLTPEEKDFILNLCKVEYRKFDLSRFPSYVGNLYEYRWKPIIIAETLNEFGAIWYMDSSIVFKKADLSHVYKLVECRKDIRRPLSVPTIEERDRREEITPHESGWDKIEWEVNVQECKKSAYLLHGYTGHGIYPATAPHIYSYFPTNHVEIKKPKSKMYEAGFVFAVKTRDTVEKILKWYVLCALEEGCMSNGTLDLSCSFGQDRFATYANCHRFDQSVVNLLAANAFHYDRHYYVSEIVDFFNVVRGGTQLVNDDAFSCESKVDDSMK